MRSISESLNLAKKIEEELRPEGGWWNSYNQDVIRESAARILRFEVPELVVTNVFETLISAIQDEYGD